MYVYKYIYIHIDICQMRWWNQSPSLIASSFESGFADSIFVSRRWIRLSLKPLMFQRHDGYPSDLKMNLDLTWDVVFETFVSCTMINDTHDTVIEIPQPWRIVQVRLSEESVVNSGKVKGVVLLLYGRSMGMISSICDLKGPEFLKDLGNVTRLWGLGWFSCHKKCAAVGRKVGSTTSPFFGTDRRPCHFII